MDINKLVRVGLLIAFLSAMGALIYRLITTGDKLDPTWAALLGSLAAGLLGVSGILKEKEKKGGDNDG
ncbi:hypothetical protein [Meiothermus granaticius]|uniref:Uncharacterized protein n=1 Tax=Meiothermus granaticius NBRC 107808 TaxID=1227551 RepID=A0A399FEM0_9DEIN|nr:hypothetical protein [Meiothermus granaticius]RIH93979.1 hypothetical protein Mgrana_00065 [Meiothermus granaticius NBRC 107808]GEM88193.1 hypothetical protein MGR01S_28180 [Meiothermus granaticius NBRC 107808]